MLAPLQVLELEIAPPSRLIPALVLATVLSSLCPQQAWANGAFPTPSQLVSEAGAPEHLLLRTTFGLVYSMDGGTSWDWICEDGLGYANVLPAIGLLDSGTLVAGIPAGILSAELDSCDFPMATGVDSDVVDLAISRSRPGVMVALTVDYEINSSQLWESTDAGSSFAPISNVFPDFIATTLDASPSDPDVLYVSGADVAGDAQGLLMRSEDHGQTFVTHAVPDSVGLLWPYIAAIDPEHPDRIYVRLSGLPGRLKVSDDGGATFSEPLQLASELQAFALSPDGTELLVSSPASGTFRADSDSLKFRQVACVGVGCLLWNDAGIYACGDEVSDGFSVGRLVDEGSTYERLLNFTCLDPTFSCSDTTELGSLCPAAWDAVGPQLSALGECDPNAAPPPFFGSCSGDDPVAGASGGGEAGAKGQSSDTAGGRLGSGGSGGAGAGTAGAAGDGSNGPPAGSGAKSSACGCRLGSENPPNHALIACAMLLLGALARRRFRSCTVKDRVD